MVCNYSSPLTFTPLREVRSVITDLPTSIGARKQPFGMYTSGLSVGFWFTYKPDDNFLSMSRVGRTAAIAGLRNRFSIVNQSCVKGARD
jgi:hypothetical protein